jgi:signal transduction histidine kinase/CheY-like chemotaxis protein
MPLRRIWAVLGAGALLSFALCLTLRSWELREFKRHAADVAQEQVERLRISVLRSMEVLHSIAALHAADGAIGQKQFHDFVQRGLERQPELAALSWNPVVSHARRAEFEAQAAADFPAFHFVEIGPGGRKIPAQIRDEYVPVYYIEPVEENVGALGYDLNSDPRRQGALEQARATGEPIATAPIKLAQGPANQPGMLVLLPIYDGPTPATGAERRARIAGFAVAVFRVNDLVRDVFQKLASRGIYARLFDGSPQGELLYAGGDDADEHSVSGPAATAMLEVAGRDWAVTFAPTRAFMAGQSHAQSWLVLAVGMLITALTAAYVHGGWRRTQEIAAANAALQEEVDVRQRAEASAGAANAAKSDFLASMSHEIRTPLNAILGYTQLMQREARLLPEQRDAVAGINASGRHLLGLINEILDLSKIEAGRMELNPADFDLATLAGELTATFRPLCVEKRVRFRLGMEGDMPARVHGDEGKLRQVLINLLGNAVKFTRAGEVFLGIKRVGEGRWQFEVIDTGQGIPEDEREDVFQPFHQGKSARRLGGTGLGLAIAHRQVALLGGCLELQSECGFGSRFFFSIPLAAARAEVHAPMSPRIVRLAPDLAVRVLVVDDHRENREVLGGLLAGVACEVSYAENAAETLAQVRAIDPDVVFLDLRLPDQSGVEVARRLREGATSLRPCVIMHTASALAEHRAEALAAGCVDFITKPVALERLCECLERHLGVRFDVADAAKEPEALPRLGDQRVMLPADLYARLTVAAELHSTTALKAVLQDLRREGRLAQQLAEEIRHLMRSYDMDGIQRLLARVVVPATEEMVKE